MGSLSLTVQVMSWYSRVARRAAAAVAQVSQLHWSTVMGVGPWATSVMGIPTRFCFLSSQSPPPNRIDFFLFSMIISM